jgi:hypothetical protein
LLLCQLCLLRVNKLRSCHWSFSVHQCHFALSQLFLEMEVFLNLVPKVPILSKYMILLIRLKHQIRQTVATRPLELDIFFVFVQF